MASKNKDEREAQQAAAAVVVAPAQQAEQAQTNAVARVRGMLEVRQDELASSLRTFGIAPERFVSVALSQFSRNPDLWRCDPLSVYRAIKEAADYGLEPTGSIGGAHLVPYGTTCTLLIDYRGLVRMVRRSGEVVRVEARVVREQDEFSFRYGLEPDLYHVPALVPDPGDLKYVYAVLIFKDGDRQFDVMSKAEVEAIRTRSRAGRSGPWVSDYFEMAKKTVLRRACKLAPLDDLTRTALAREDEREGEARAPEHVGATVSRLPQLRQQLAERLTPQVGEATAQQVAEQADPALFEGVAEVTDATYHEQDTPPGGVQAEPLATPPSSASQAAPPAQPTTDVAGRPLASAEHDEAEQAEAEQGMPVAPGQIGAFEAPPPVHSEPTLVDNSRAQTRPTVDSTPAPRPTCGATVSGPDSTTYTCSLAPGHRGEHTDGQHDWPQR